MKTSVFLAAVLAALVAVSGAAQAQGQREAVDFDQLDLNQDGSVTMEEMQARRDARFTTTDTDGDGGLSVAEIVAAAEGRAAARAERMIERLDANGDGILQQVEMQTDRAAGRAARMFERADANGDGAISAAEFETAQANRAERNKPRGGQPGDDG
ncbi:MAG: calcium-binding protein [Pseudomonadota bacterium]